MFPCLCLLLGQSCRARQLRGNCSRSRVKKVTNLTQTPTIFHCCADRHKPQSPEIRVLSTLATAEDPYLRRSRSAVASTAVDACCVVAPDCGVLSFCGLVRLSTAPSRQQIKAYEDAPRLFSMMSYGHICIETNGHVAGISPKPQKFIN